MCQDTWNSFGVANFEVCISQYLKEKYQLADDNQIRKIIIYVITNYDKIKIKTIINKGIFIWKVI